MAIAITMGDSSGVGPEIILKAYRQGELPDDSVVVGDLSILNVCNRMLDYNVPLRKAASITDVRQGFLNVFDLGLMKESDLCIGEISKLSGYAALKYVETATKLALAKE
ncbi:MAG TPA: 4-phospho-D-threonate 3-dehydrogenase, partial [Blastocatellia bacterium]|nr:4-phospho-D-threonate 3-dehydrogenase [Blastocatellia bacterium]